MTIEKNINMKYVLRTNEVEPAQTQLKDASIFFLHALSKSDENMSKGSGRSTPSQNVSVKHVFLCYLCHRVDSFSWNTIYNE